MRNYSRQVSMLCPICGNDQFETLDYEDDELVDVIDDLRFRCSDCGTIFTREEVIEENSERIDIVINNIERDLVKEAEKEIKRLVDKWRL